MWSSILYFNLNLKDYSNMDNPGTCTIIGSIIFINIFLIEGSFNGGKLSSQGPKVQKNKEIIGVLDIPITTEEKLQAADQPIPSFGLQSERENVSRNINKRSGTNYLIGIYLVFFLVINILTIYMLTTSFITAFFLPVIIVNVFAVIWVFGNRNQHFPHIWRFIILLTLLLFLLFLRLMIAIFIEEEIAWTLNAIGYASSFIILFMMAIIRYRETYYNV